ncbi:cyclic nucleotide-binding domain-containing protein [Candidatus Riflebacteria bacterium]
MEFAFGNIDLFQNLSIDNLKRIEDKAFEEFYELGEVLFSEGDPGDAFYIIVSGKVGVYKNTLMGDRVLVAQLFPGQYFGEMALFKKDTHRNASIIALTNTTVIKIDHSILLALMKNRKFSLELMSSLAGKIETMNTKALSGKEDESWKTKKTKKEKSATIITISGVKDGIGKTTSAAILAEVLAARKGCYVLLLELDLIYDDLNIMYNQITISTVEKLILKLKTENMRMSGDLDFDIWTFLTKLKDGLYLLPSVHDIFEGEKISSFDIQVLLKSLKTEFDFIVIDSGCNMDEVQHEVLIQSEKIAFHICVNDIVDIKNSIKISKVLLSMGLNEASVKLVIAAETEIRPVAGKINLPFAIGGIVPHLQHPLRVVNETFLAEESFQILAEFWIDYLEKELKIDRSFLKKETSSEFRLFSFNKDKKGKVEEKHDPQTLISGPKVKNLKPDSLVFGEPAEIDVRGLYFAVYHAFVTADFQAAFKQIQDIATVTDKGAEYYKALSEYYWWVEEETKTELALKKYCRLNPNDKFMKARLEYYSARAPEIFAGMVRDFRKFANEKNKFADIQFQAALICMLDDDIKAALDYLGVATEINPNYLMARIIQVKLMQKEDMFEESKEALKYIPENNPFHIYYLSQILLKEKRFKAAYNKLLTLSEMPQSVYFEIDSVLKELVIYLNKITEIIKMYEKMLQDRPSGMGLKIQLLKLYLEVEDMEKFYAFINKMEEDAGANLKSKLTVLKQWAART